MTSSHIQHGGLQYENSFSVKYHVIFAEICFTKLDSDCYDSNLHFYRAMHFSAKRGIAIACRLSVCLSVCNVGEL